MSEPIETGGRGTTERGEPDAHGCAGGGHRAAVPPGPEERAAREAARPAWASAAAATHTLDARPMLAAGEHPVGQVLALLSTFTGDEVLQLVTPFVPDPLVERARGMGYAAHGVIEEVGVVRTFFRRAVG